MSEWHECELGDIATLHYGKALKASERVSGSVPVYSSAGETGSHNKAIVESKGLIVGRKGTVGKIYMSEKPFWCIDTAYYILPNDDVYDFRFLFYLLGTLGFEALNEDSAVPGLNRNTAYKQKLLLPKVEEQKAIVLVLSSLDNKIDLLHRQSKTLEAMAETLFRQWFVEGGAEDCPITDLIDFNPTRKLSKGAVAPYLEMASLSTTTFSPDSWYDREFSSGTKFINGDTLLARITPCLENGKTAYVTFLDDDQVAWGSTEYIVMRPHDKLHPFFGYVLAKNQVFREYAEGCMAGSSGRQRVDINHLKKFDIGAASSEAIGQFNMLAETVVPKLHANMQQIKTLEKLRDTLLPKLVSGEVRVQP